MTTREIEDANTINAAKSAIKLLKHIGAAHGYQLDERERHALNQLVSGATCNNYSDLLSEEYFAHIISPVIYQKCKKH